jgi:hypothetical protein
VVIDNSRSKGSAEPWRETQNTVTSGIGNPPAMFGNEPVHDLTMGSQGMKGADFVLAHQARIACHVSRENGNQSPLDLVLLPIHWTLGAVPEGILLPVGQGVQSRMIVSFPPTMPTAPPEPERQPFSRQKLLT